ncbi:hypothetical protein [Thalassobellus citreus]|uniref:hypothetical protein n=1 Tax=Thalassobellus citreus TaxID=3367752 RepID=UPI0037ABE806
MKLTNNLSSFLIFTGTIILFSFLTLTSCQNQSTEFEWTEKEKEIAKKEISNVAKMIIESAEKVDIQSAIEPYLNSSEFMVVNPDGSIDNYDNFKINGIKSFKQFTAYNQTTIKEEYRFLNKDLVLYTWIGKAEIILKTGEKMNFDSYVGTMLFNKLNNKWRITYAHETASPPVIEE